MKFNHMIFHIRGYVHEIFDYYIKFNIIIVFKKTEILNGVNRFKLSDFLLLLTFFKWVQPI